MDITARITQAEQKFNTLQQEREQHLKSAEDCLTEMTKLQGEFRVLQELKPSKKAKTVEAIAEKK